MNYVKVQLHLHQRTRATMRYICPLQVLQECFLVCDPTVPPLCPDIYANVCHANPRCRDIPQSRLQHSHSHSDRQYQPHLCWLLGLGNCAGHFIYCHHPPFLLPGYLEAEIPARGKLSGLHIVIKCAISARLSSMINLVCNHF